MQRINALLQQSTPSAFNKHHAEIQAIQKIWEAIAPDNLAQLSRAASIKNQQLTLVTSSNAVAAKIKLLIPSLLILLEKKECKVTSIRVKMQVKSSPQRAIKPERKLSPHATHALKELLANLDNSPLKDIISRLAKRS